MISCLILYHPTILSMTKVISLRVMFKDYDYEIEVLGHHTVVMQIWQIDKYKIWQAALEFETTNICIGYGFAENTQQAKINAFEHLLDRLATADKNRCT